MPTIEIYTIVHLSVIFLLILDYINYYIFNYTIVDFI